MILSVLGFGVAYSSVGTGPARDGTNLKGDQARRELVRVRGFRGWMLLVLPFAFCQSPGLPGLPGLPRIH